jgi:hypothetical protein
MSYDSRKQVVQAFLTTTASAYISPNTTTQLHYYINRFDVFRLLAVPIAFNLALKVKVGTKKAKPQT